MLLQAEAGPRYSLHVRGHCAPAAASGQVIINVDVFKILETMNSWHWGELIVECSKRCCGGSSRSTTQCTVNIGARHLRQSTINILKCCILWLLVVWRVRVCVNTPSSPDTSTTARDTCGISRLGDQIWLTVVNMSGYEWINHIICLCLYTI